MRTRHKRRLGFIGLGLALLAGAAVLALRAFEESIVFFYSPSEILAKSPTADRRLRIGGLVEAGSVERAADATVRFRVTDLTTAVPVSYRGILPDLFREGQGVIAEGHYRDGGFVADEVLAKHDETYMPPEVAAALKKSGQWKPAAEARK